MTLIKSTFLGLAVADAIGVPVEFRDRPYLEANPVNDMMGYGTYNQPPGTWSDDSSLTFCLAESLLNGYDLEDMARRFIDWKTKARWTPHGEVFDIGITTSSAINLLISMLENGDADSLTMLHIDADEYSNGNGSLMRIIPLYFFLKDKGIEKQFDIIWQVSALTHGHIRAAIACLIYLVLFDELLETKEKRTAYQNTQQRIKAFFNNRQIASREVAAFHRVIEQDISGFDITQIKSDGYVLHSLEASIWCLLNNDDYVSTILQAVNLGHDTDTTAAIVGGLAGGFYGLKSIPEKWINQLAQLEQILRLCDQFQRQYG